METNVQKPSLFRIIQSDYIAGLSLLFVLVTWALYLILIYYGRIGTRATAADAPFFLNLAIVATLLGIPLLVWRINYYKSLFKKAEEIKGYITYIRFYRDRGKVRYEYMYKNEKHLVQNAIFKSGRTKHYRQGDEVTLIVDPGNPKKAIIRDIYI